MKPSRTASLAVVTACIVGCASYTGPSKESTAYPPTNPPRPEPVQRTVVRHEVVTKPTTESREKAAEFAQAYAKRGKPMVAVVLFDAANSIIISPALVALTYSETAISTRAATNAESGSASASVHRKSTSSTSFQPTGTTSPHQLQSWSDVQQVFFDTMRRNGVRLVDPEMVTLTKLDKFIERTSQGVSLHTAELESLRNTLQFDILMLVQEVFDGSDSYLQGRVWDLKDGALLAAERLRLRMGTESETAKVMVRARAKNLADILLAQTAQAWSAA